VVAIDPHRQTFQGYGVSGTPSFVIVDPDGIVRLYQSGYTMDGGLHVDGWTFDGRPRSAPQPEQSPSPSKRR
jgi:hypothetical protein